MKTTYTRSLLTIHLFYAVILFLTYENFTIAIFEKNIVAPSEFVELLKWLPRDSFTIFTKSLCGIAFLSFLSCTIYPWIRTLRLMSFLSLLFFIAIQSSYGKINHGYYGYLFASLTLIFLPKIYHAYDELNVNKKQAALTVQILFIAQFCAILCYALAGLWKLRYIPQTYSSGGWPAISQALGNTIAYEHLTYSHPVSTITQFFLNHDNITTLLFFGLIALQVLSPLLVFFTEAHLIFGILFVVFHILSEVILKIPFKPQMYLMAVLFIFSPFARLKFWQKKSLQ